MSKQKSRRPAAKASDEKSSTLPREAGEGWARWHQPKVLIPLVAVLLAAAGLTLNFVTAKSGKQEAGSISNAGTPNSQVAAAEAGSAVDPGSTEPAPVPEVDPTPQSRAPRRSQPEPAAPPQVPSPLISQPPSVDIRVDRSPGAITAQTINANTIEVRPE